MASSCWNISFSTCKYVGCVRLLQVKFPLPWVWSVTDPAASWSSTASVSSIKERPKPTSSRRPMTFPPSVFSSAPGVSIGFSMYGQQKVWQYLTWLCHLLKVTLVFCVSFQEFMTFTSALIVERSTQGSRASIKEQGKKRHSESDSDGSDLSCWRGHIMLLCCTLTRCWSEIIVKRFGGKNKELLTVGPVTHQFHGPYSERLVLPPFPRMLMSYCEPRPLFKVRMTLCDHGLRVVCVAVRAVTPEWEHGGSLR